MLCFVFSALVVVLDQLFKRWAVIALSGGGDITLIPKIIGLTYVENTGAAFSMFSDMRWPLAAVQFICVVIIIAILLRYNDGFWGRLGLAAVLGGAVGNLIDRVLVGYVVDMFEFLFVRFAIFNIADIFITLGGITFCVFFIVSAVRPKTDAQDKSYLDDDAPEQSSSNVIDIENVRHHGVPPDTNPIPVPPPTGAPPPHRRQPPQSQPPQQPQPPQQQRQQRPQQSGAGQPAAEPKAPAAPASNFDELSSFTGEFSPDSLLENFDLDKILAEYGFENDDN